ncbi:MAG: alanine racemase [Candidatus Marinimicrobia bacterium]|nr:alanine racemase [Candidatus Neomarinimicrobiota bacterium]
MNDNPAFSIQHPASNIQYLASNKPYTVAEIYLDHLVYNLMEIRKKVAPAEVMCVVKADAYGHGAVEVTKRLVKEGVTHFAVARVAEAIELRNAGITDDILIFGSLFPDEIETAIQNNIQISITDATDIDRIRDIAFQNSMPVNVHLNIDTGMGRVGIPFHNAQNAIIKIANIDQLKLEGIYTHFATSDEHDKEYAGLQLHRFNDIIGQIIDHLHYRPLLHAANSGAILDLPEAKFDMVRAGISLYGHYPTTETSESIPLKQVMTLKTHVGLVRRLAAGSSVSYGRKFIAEKETSVAVLPIGYADGIHRAMTNNADVLINGKLYPLVGTLTMDQIMVNVGDDPVNVGDAAIFWGDTPLGKLQATKVAHRIGTISYELCCAITKRVPRIYID